MSFDFKIFNSAELWQIETSLPSIPTFSQNLDKVLGNDGVQLGSLTELLGLPGSGKTQLCLQLCASVQIPKSLGGLYSEALYIDTNTNFTLHRFKEILYSSLEKCQRILGNQISISEDEVLKKLHYIKTIGIEKFCSCMYQLKDFLSDKPNIKLIVIDSIAFPFKDGVSLKQRTGLLFRMMADLQKLSIEKRIAVVLTNEMTTRIGLSSGSIVGSLGDAWAHRCNKRLLITAPKPLENIRLALLLKSNNSPESVGKFQVLTALSFYATGTYQKPVGMSFLHGLSQSSVSNAIKEVTNALNSSDILQKYIRFPQTQEERQIIINGFYNKFGFPGVLGCIDGTHVALVRPSEHEERFFNRKHYHSRNVQIICDSDLNILNVDATFGGASHDAYIWRQCEVNQHIQELHNNGETLWLLGDSGYPLRPWLLTPIVNAAPETPEECYTNVHCRARNTVYTLNTERCIGVLKARWRCLLVHRVLHYDHHTVAKIINACCVLHNMANRARLPVPELSTIDMETERNQQEPHGNLIDRVDSNQSEYQLLQNGRRQLSIIVQRLWRNRT